MHAGDQSLDRPFTYRVPEGMTIVPGECVVVPLGTRQELGYVLALTSVPEMPADLNVSGALPPPLITYKPVREALHVPPVFDRATASLFCWMARQYLCGMSDALRCVVPARRLATVKTLIRLPPEAEIPEGLKSPVKLAVLETLREVGGEADLADLQKTIRTPKLSAAIRELARRGSLEVIRTPNRPSEPKTATGYRLVAAASDATAWLEKLKRRTRACAVLETLVVLDGAPMALRDLAQKLEFKPESVRSSARRLIDEGLIELAPIAVRRSPWPEGFQIPLKLALTPDQSTALETILSAVRRSAERSMPPLLSVDATGAAEALSSAPRPETVLLRGVTGSGKTEVYLQAIEETRKLGRQSITLVPEISLTAQMVGIFGNRFGSRVAVLHSKLSDGERMDEWERIRKGEVDVVIGARSALFAPVPRLGLIVLDEEHEGAYKQDSAPRYSTRETAVERARLTGACVVFGSATPSLESAWLVERGVMRLAEMPRRIDDRPLPIVTLVDQRRELKENPGRLFSRKLEEAIRLRLSRGEQSILFLNRRGFATVTLCRDCGYVAHCRNCAVSLTYYASSKMLRCHHCEFAMKAPDTCPSCHGINIKQFGVGTEKVESEIRALFPEARMARMDMDSTRQKGSLQDLVGRFRRRQLDILVGTQMVAKGFDFPGVTLVGVISADTMLNLPDFRAAERTFQLLTQVAGRAGRGDQPGEVLIQTFNPEHYSIQAAREHNFEEFFTHEIPLRREAGYPPFQQLANLIVEGSSRQDAVDRAARIAAALLDAIGDLPVQILGPAPAPLIRVKNRYRWHILLKCAEGQLLRDVCRQMRINVRPDDLRETTIDLDPMSLL